jgi:DNA-binding GntR family transcriptional regulator
VKTVFDEILAAVHDGTLLPGQRISDAELADQFGVSRTPVREALQRLREIGIIEASPSRFTRVAVVAPEQTAQAFIVWHALFRALVEDVIPRAPESLAEELDNDHAEFLAALTVLDAQRIATTNFYFFSRITAQTSNPMLQRALVSVVHIVRLGSLHLPDYIDFRALGRAQGLLIEAARTRDLELAREAVTVLGGIEVPT